MKPNPRKPHTEPERITTETESCHAEQHSVESSSYVKPSPLIFIYDTGPSLPSLFQISEEWIFHQNLLLQGSWIVLHSEERVRPKLFKLFALTSCVYICRCPKFYVKPSPLIFIYDTGPSLPSLFQISEEWIFHQNLLLQGSRIVLHSEERVRPKQFKLFALTSCVYICRCPKIYVKPSPLIFIYDTGPSVPSLFQISEEWIFHQNLLLQGSRIVLHSEERVRPKLFKLFALTSCVYICRCPKIYVKPSLLIFIYDTGPSLPSLFQISEEWIFHQNLLLQGYRIVLHSEERVRPKTSCVYICRCPKIYVKPSPLIFIYDTGPSLPSLFQISEEWIFHQNLLLQGSRIVLHSEERVRPKLFKLFALTSCVYICRCPKIYVKPSPLIFIYDTGPSLPSLFQISEERIFHQNLLLQGSRIVLHSEERVRPKLFKLFALTSCVYICRCPIIYVI